MTFLSFLCWQDDDIISTTVNATTNSHNSTAGETKIISTTAISNACVSSPENDENRPPAANFVPETPAQVLAGKGRRLLGSEEDFFVPGSQSSPLPGVGRIKHDVVFKVIILWRYFLLHYIYSIRLGKFVVISRNIFLVKTMLRNLFFFKLKLKIY